MCSSGGGGGRPSIQPVPVDPAEQARRAAQKQREIEEAARQRAAEEAARRAEEARIAAEKERQRQISLGRTNIDDAFSRFNDSYYSQLDKQYEDYARGDIDTQYQDQLRRLVGALSGIDNIAYATRNQGVEDLGSQYRSAIDMVDEGGDTIADQARNEANAARERLIQRNSSVANASAIADEARKSAENLAGTSRMSRLASIFVDPMQYAASRPGYGGRPAVFGSSNSTGTSGGSSRVVG
jgi:hypothetical protein